MIAQFRFGYENWLTPEQLDALKFVISPDPQLRKLRDDERPRENGALPVETYTSHVGNVQKVMTILGGSKGIELTGLDNVNPLVEMSNQIAALTSEVQRLSGAAFNEKVGVAVPDAPLMETKQTKVLYDECTEALDQYLEDGWYIIAACPQSDQRRPDYVIGRKDRIPD
jgi:hypothetical protein